MDVKKIEKKARALMDGKYKKGEKLPLLYYHILEDANFHSENNRLTKDGAFGLFRTEKDMQGTPYYVPLSYGTGQKDYGEYKKLGGKTWQL